MSSNVGQGAERARIDHQEAQHQRAQTMADLSNDMREHVYNVTTDESARPRVIGWVSEGRSKAAADNHRQQTRQRDVGQRDDGRRPARSNAAAENHR